MSKTTAPPGPSLYLDDETAWLDWTAGLVEERRFDELDAENLSEFLRDMARRDRREVESRLIQWLAHILKWTYQPERRSGSWRASIELQHQDLVALLESGTLRNHAEAVLPMIFSKAVRLAAAETGLAIGSFPAECPYTIDQIEGLDILAE